MRSFNGDRQLFDYFLEKLKTIEFEDRNVSYKVLNIVEDRFYFKITKESIIKKEIIDKFAKNLYQDARNKLINYSNVTNEGDFIIPQNHSFDVSPSAFATLLLGIRSNITVLSLGKIIDKLLNTAPSNASEIDRLLENYVSLKEERRNIVGSQIFDLYNEIQFGNLYFENDSYLKELIQNAIRSGKSIILIGPPGTGKSKIAEKICNSLKVSNYFVTAHSEWSVHDTIGGYTLQDSKNLIFEPGHFLKTFANQDNKTNLKWLIIDEINRADIDKAFGSLFSTFSGNRSITEYKDQQGRKIVIQFGNNDFLDHNEYYTYFIHQDWRMIATMNSYDKASLFEMSYAFMRRFAFIPVMIPKEITETIIFNYLECWQIEDDEYSNKVSKLWNIINKIKPFGPAIIEDIYKYLLVSNGNFTGALIAYVIPQFEGIPQEDIKSFYSDVTSNELLDESGKEILASFIKDFFGPI
jgi:MoxR-like ATPase